MGEAVQRELGVYETEIATIKTNIKEMRDDIREIRDSLQQRRGASKMLVMVFSITGALAGSAATILVQILGA